ncbi:MAG TPA: hypothetical protein VKT71_12060 [Candidatus Acidoferrales bacterium]|nr:hypothetical protein [Candidatus Acidoferrales bacterium]
MDLAYDVVLPFEATEAISSRTHRFVPGDVVICGMTQDGPTVTIEAEAILYLVARATFKNCCKFKNEGMGGGI